jgi:hypothetical protein
MKKNKLILKRATLRRISSDGLGAVRGGTVFGGPILGGGTVLAPVGNNGGLRRIGTVEPGMPEEMENDRDNNMRNA